MIHITLLTRGENDTIHIICVGVRTLCSCSHRYLLGGGWTLHAGASRHHLRKLHWQAGLAGALISLWMFLNCLPRCDRPEVR